MKSLTIAQMKLTRNAELAAQMVLGKHPDARFTSGRRALTDQARVMAFNTSMYGPDWLLRTYKNQRMVKLLVNHVTENPDQLRDIGDLSQNFYSLLSEHFGREFKMMPHVVGRAFDIGWPRNDKGEIDREAGEVICKTIEDLPAELGLELLLRKEGKLDVIHAQFASPTQEVI